MSLFRRKQQSEEEDERCPNCRERVPEGAATCEMCGLDLAEAKRVGPAHD
jgi:predicted amidophosphoribosyltransferase